MCPPTFPYRPNVLVMGDHTGAPRRVARGLRAACRPLPDRWRDEIAGVGEVWHRVLSWLDGVPVPDGVESVAWVPGHDGSPGPGFVLAYLVGEAWSLPVEELVVRRRLLRSAWGSEVRPTPTVQLASLAVPAGRPRRLVLVDNTIATGASLLAAATTLSSAGHDVAALVAVTASGRVG